jgi:hypothetical protein
MRRYRTPTSHHQTHSNRADEQVFESPSRSEPLFDQVVGHAAHHKEPAARRTPRARQGRAEGSPLSVTREACMGYARIQ